MRKLVPKIDCSLDGFVCGPNGELERRACRRVYIEIILSDACSSCCQWKGKKTMKYLCLICPDRRFMMEHLPEADAAKR